LQVTAAQRMAAAAQRGRPRLNRIALGGRAPLPRGSGTSSAALVLPAPGVVRVSGQTVDEYRIQAQLSPSVRRLLHAAAQHSQSVQRFSSAGSSPPGGGAEPTAAPAQSSAGKPSTSRWRHLAQSVKRPAVVNTSSMRSSRQIVGVPGPAKGSSTRTIRRTASGPIAGGVSKPGEAVQQKASTTMMQSSGDKSSRVHSALVRSLSAGFNTTAAKPVRQRPAQTRKQASKRGRTYGRMAQKEL